MTFKGKVETLLGRHGSALAYCPGAARRAAQRSLGSLALFARFVGELSGERERILQSGRRRLVKFTFF
jgi:hypothetical protein